MKPSDNKSQEKSIAGRFDCQVADMCAKFLTPEIDIQPLELIEIPIENNDNTPDPPNAGKYDSLDLVQ